jgi:hypothetical protein
MKILLVVGEFFYADVRTHMMDLVVVFRSFANAPKILYTCIYRGIKHIFTWGVRRDTSSIATLW